MVARWELRPFTFDLDKPLLAWLFGATIGRNVAIGGDVDEPFLLTIGDGAVLGHGSLVVGSVIAKGAISRRSVCIGAGATVGVNAVVLVGTTLGEHAILAGGIVRDPGLGHSGRNLCLPDSRSLKVSRGRTFQITDGGLHHYLATW